MDQVAIPMLETELTLLSAEEGGRRWPLDLSHRDAFYRPHLVVGDPGQRHALVDANGVSTEEYLGVQFVPADLKLAPGDSATIRMQLIFYPACTYDRLTVRPSPSVRAGLSLGTGGFCGGDGLGPSNKPLERPGFARRSTPRLMSGMGETPI